MLLDVKQLNFTGNGFDSYIRSLRTQLNKKRTGFTPDKPASRLTGQAGVDSAVKSEFHKAGGPTQTYT
jgi:hypothetical protein